MMIPALLLPLTLQVAQGPAPSPTPPPTIIRLKVSPFCKVFRENIFEAVKGLRINDVVIDQGRAVLAKWAYDSVVDQPHNGIGGKSLQLDQVQLGFVVTQAAHNLHKIYDLLNDPALFPKDPRTEEDRDLAVMKARLQEVAAAQEQSLNLLSGIYETSALNYLLSRGSNVPPGMGAPISNAGAPSDAMSTSSGGSIDLGDPIFKTPGVIYPPNFTSQKGASLFAGNPVGRVDSGVAVTQRLTGAREVGVTAAVLPGVDRCGGGP